MRPQAAPWLTRSKPAEIAMAGKSRPYNACPFFIAVVRGSGTTAALAKIGDTPLRHDDDGKQRQQDFAVCPRSRQVQRSPVTASVGT